jgi:Lon protease-like protein
VSLALFPLNTVLFPGCSLDLQIFEPRYLSMISRCMKQNSSFGVVCIVEGAEVGAAAAELAAVGCEALIRDFQQLPNGLLGIRVVGGRRFRVERAQVLADQSTMAQVQWLDEPQTLALDEAHDDLLALLGALSAHPLVASLALPSPADQQGLLNQLAYLLPLDSQRKVQLLAMDDIDAGLQLLQQLLEQLQAGVSAGT